MLATKGLESYRALSAEDSIVELSLMMSRCQFDSLEQQAHACGMSVAQFLRRLVQQSIDQDAIDE